MREARSVGFAEREARFVDAQVRAGRHASAGEAVREALRRCEEDPAAEQAAVAALEALAAEGAAPIEAGDFDAAATPDAVRALFAAFR